LGRPGYKHFSERPLGELYKVKLLWNIFHANSAPGLAMLRVNTKLGRFQ